MYTVRLRVFRMSCIVLPRTRTRSLVSGLCTSLTILHPLMQGFSTHYWWNHGSSPNRNTNAGELCWFIVSLHVSWSFNTNECHTSNACNLVGLVRYEYIHIRSMYISRVLPLDFWGMRPPYYHSRGGNCHPLPPCAAATD